MENSELISKRKSSRLWNYFTIKDRDSACCDICGHTLSYRSSVSNLKKHIIRKHPNISLPPSQADVKKEKPAKRLKTSDFDDIVDGLELHVMTDEEYILAGEVNPEENENEEQRAQAISQEEEQPSAATQQTIHIEEVYTTGTPQKNNEQRSTQRLLNVNFPPEKKKRNRIMDLQIECLELKKYHMTMEALLLEQQLNLPRSSFTKTLALGDKINKGTQTEISGNNTKVLYVLDGSNKEGSPHLFSFSAVEKE